MVPARSHFMSLEMGDGVGDIKRRKPNKSGSMFSNQCDHCTVHTKY